MSWRWSGDPAVRDTVARETGLDKTFPTQGEAETWLGECYPDLLEAGVRAVSLYEEGRLVYGPMRLEPEV
jgi:hypothetical protein